LDLNAQYRSIREEVDDAIAEVIRTSRFILGAEETKFERAFADLHRAPYAVGCSCGTSAIYIALQGLKVPAGAEVIVPSMTYIATAEAVSMAGATPVFVDCEPDTGLMDYDSMVCAVTRKTWG
jgi:dTDP-4-amino-4,6-dideoxygalactose transaminase